MYLLESQAVKVMVTFNVVAAFLSVLLLFLSLSLLPSSPNLAPFQEHQVEFLSFGIAVLRQRSDPLRELMSLLKFQEEGSFGDIRRLGDVKISEIIISEPDLCNSCRPNSRTRQRR